MSVRYPDHEKFFWCDLDIVSPPITFRQLLSPHLVAYLGGAVNALDNTITSFQSVPCTGVYILADSSSDMFILICRDSNTIDEFHYDRDGYDVEFCFSDTEHKMTVKEHTWCKSVQYNDDIYNSICRVNQEILDSLRMQCDGMTVDKDGRCMSQTS